jgi:hypothetical protein
LAAEDQGGEVEPEAALLPVSLVLGWVPVKPHVVMLR